MRRLQAALFLLWFLISLAGIDIHKDLEHGRTYVVPAVIAQSCEMIHPHQHCHDHDHDAAGTCEEDEDCCSDDFESVTVTATDSEGPDHIFIASQPLPAIILTATALAASTPMHRMVHKNGPPPGRPSPVISFCAMRA